MRLSREIRGTHVEVALISAHACKFDELTLMTAKASAFLIEKTAQLIDELNRVELEELK